MNLFKRRPKVKLEFRVRHGNTLCTLGYREEAETHCLAALERDPTVIEALFNVVALRAARGETQAAHDCLRRVVECVPQSRHPRVPLAAGGPRGSL
jgi:tetratricopeptide (TPR) repeat protein